VGSGLAAFGRSRNDGFPRSAVRPSVAAESRARCRRYRRYRRRAGMRGDRGEQRQLGKIGRISSARPMHGDGEEILTVVDPMLLTRRHWSVTPGTGFHSTAPNGVGRT